MVRRDGCEQPKENEMSFTLTQEQDVGGAGVVRDFSLNASGQSVGFSEVTAGATYDPVLWSVTGNCARAHRCGGGIGWGSARALNDGGQSVGFELMPNGQSAAVMWSSTVQRRCWNWRGLSHPGVSDQRLGDQHQGAGRWQRQDFLPAALKPSCGLGEIRRDLVILAFKVTRGCRPSIPRGSAPVMSELRPRRTKA